MAEVIMDKQFKTIVEMMDMILDGCKDLEEAKKKVQKLIENGNTVSRNFCTDKKCINDMVPYLERISIFKG